MPFRKALQVASEPTQSKSRDSLISLGEHGLFSFRQWPELVNCFFGQVWFLQNTELWSALMLAKVQGPQGVSMATFSTKFRSLRLVALCTHTKTGTGNNQGRWNGIKRWQQSRNKAQQKLATENKVKSGATMGQWTRSRMKHVAEQAVSVSDAVLQRHTGKVQF